MRNATVLTLLFLCLAAVAVAGTVTKGLRSPEGVGVPTLIRMRAIPQIAGPGNSVLFETPYGFESGRSKESVMADPVIKSRSFAPFGGGGGATTPAGPTVGTNFSGPVQNGMIPYNAAIAAGPSHLIAMSNAQFAIYTKSGTLLSLTQNSQFFPTDAGTSYNPQCFYDTAQQHFVLVTMQAQNPCAYLNVAVSQTSDPTGAWWMYHLDWSLDGATQTGNYGDWMTLGCSNQAIFVTANQFSFAGIYQYSKVRVLTKALLYSGAPATWSDFVNLRNADGTSAFCLVAGQMLSSSESGYLLNNRPAGGSSLTLWRIDNVLTVPTLTLAATVAVSAYAVPPDGRQPGKGSPYVATGDCRLQNLVMQGGYLFTAFTYNAGSRVGAGVRFLKLSTSGTVAKDVSYSYGGIDYYYPAVTVDPSGNMLMVLSRSSTTYYPSVCVTGMRTTDAAIAGPVVVKAGAGKVMNGRWGYNAIENDPVSVGSVWIYGGWEQTTSLWGTYVSSASFGAPATTQPVYNGAESIARSFALHSNYPNPFNPATVISYTLPEETPVSLAVYDALGRRVAQLVDEVQGPGDHQTAFNASGFSSGIYYYRLQAGRNTSAGKMLLSR